MAGQKSEAGVSTIRDKAILASLAHTVDDLCQVCLGNGVPFVLEPSKQALGGGRRMVASDSTSVQAQPTLLFNGMEVGTVHGPRHPGDPRLLNKRVDRSRPVRRGVVVP